MFSILKIIMRFLLGYGDTKNVNFRPLKALQKYFYQWALSRPVFSYKVFHFFLSPFIKEVAEVQGHKMYLDRGDSLGLSVFGVFEPFMTKMVNKEVKEGDVVVDIGASIGYYTLIFAKLVGENGKVFAFEPAPDIFALLDKNVKTNGYKNVIMKQNAVSNKTEKSKLYLCGYNNMAHTLCDLHDGYHQWVEIESIKLNDYFADYNGKIDLIKLDVEGAECAAVEGLSNLLEKNKNVKIITEFHPKWLKMFGSDPEEYLNLLVKYGFKLYNINEENEKIELISINELLKIYTTEKRTWTNLLCKR